MDEKRRRLIKEVWEEYFKEDIETCVVMREENGIRPSCGECDCFAFCAKVFELEAEDV